MSETRKRLPARRPSSVFGLRFQGVDYVITTGHHASGEVAEVFISSTKVGSGIAALARDAAVSISLALQHGCELRTLTDAVTREEDGSAAGIGGAVLDEILRREAERLSARVSA